MLIRSNFSDLFTADALPVLEERLVVAYEQHPSQRDMMFVTKSTDRDIYQSTEMHDLGLFQVVPEGTKYSFDRMRQGASKTLTPKKYGQGFAITREAVEDGKFDFIGDAMAMIGDSARESQEISAANILNGAFDSTTVASGAYLCSATQNLPSGLSFRNRLSTDSDLSVSSYEQMQLDFRTQFVRDSGIKVKHSPRTLLVAPMNLTYAQELLGSDLKIDTAENNMNVYKSMGVRPMDWVHLTDDDAWFLIGDKEKTGLRIINRKGLETSSEEQFINDSILYKANYREEVGAIHPYAIFGSPGAA